MPLGNFGVINPRLFRSAQPDIYGFYSAKALGVDLVYKLNSKTESDPNEERRYINIVEDEPSVFHPSVEWCKNAVTSILEYQKAGYMILIHCSHGRDRTGLLSAAYRRLIDKWPVTKTLDEFRSYGATGFIEWMDHEIEEVIRSL